MINVALFASGTISKGSDRRQAGSKQAREEGRIGVSDGFPPPLYTGGHCDVGPPHFFPAAFSVWTLTAPSSGVGQRRRY